MTNFEARWEELPPHPESAVFQRVDEQHPLDFYLGKDVTGEWTLLLVTDEQPADSSHIYQAIHVITRKRNDGRWALLFRLVTEELGKLFSLLCEDLVESSRHIEGLSRPASFVMARFTRWQRLLERGGSGLLDEATLRGLVGELLFMERFAIRLKGIHDAVSGWQGPAGADRDFMFPGHDFEIKTIRAGATSVRISSAEQLDVQDKTLDLVVIQIDDADVKRHPDAFTPLELVARLRTTIEPDSSATEMFESRLMEAGFVAREEYGQREFRVVQIRTFRVTGDFPAIRRSQLPSAIGRVIWEVDLQAILPFEVTMRSSQKEGETYGAG